MVSAAGVTAVWVAAGLSSAATLFEAVSLLPLQPASATSAINARRRFMASLLR
jgi:hypothetical protein